jgi:hypothetical protein
MKKISEKEKQRILELHYKTTLRPYLFEQIYDDSGLGYSTAVGAKPPIKPTAPKIPTWPLKNNEEGNMFRKWVNNNYPKLSEFLKLEKDGKLPNSYNDEVITKAWNYPLRISDVEKKLGDWFTGNLKFDEIKPKFYQRMLPLLEQAKTWWRNWLRNPETRVKFKKLNYIFFRLFNR